MLNEDSRRTWVVDHPRWLYGAFVLTTGAASLLVAGVALAIVWGTPGGSGGCDSNGVCLPLDWGSTYAPVGFDLAAIGATFLAVGVAILILRGPRRVRALPPPPAPSRD
jgi:hypothetical protein